MLNHLSYAVVIPGLENTRSIRALDHYAALGSGLVSWAASVLMGLLIAMGLAATAARKNAGHVRWVLALVAAWIVPRVVFYCWWDPVDPFLFAVMSLPGVWLIVFGFAAYSGGSARFGNPSYLGFRSFAGDYRLVPQLPIFDRCLENSRLNLRQRRGAIAP